MIGFEHTAVSVELISRNSRASAQVIGNPRKRIHIRFYFTVSFMRKTQDFYQLCALVRLNSRRLPRAYVRDCFIYKCISLSDETFNLAGCFLRWQGMRNRGPFHTRDSSLLRSIPFPKTNRNDRRIAFRDQPSRVC